MNKPLLEIFKCALSNKEHFLVKPITLTCGHSVCQDCISDENTIEINCKICDLVSKQDFKTFSVSEIAQQALSMSISDIFQILAKETTDGLSDLKGKVELFILVISFYLNACRSN